MHPILGCLPFPQAEAALGGATQHNGQPGWNQSLMWPLSRPAARYRQHRPLRAFLRC